MYPYTAMKLKESNKNTLKDFLGVAGHLGVTHMQILTQTDNGNYIRLVKNPKGPTLTFKIDEYALSKDVVAYQQETKRNNKIFSSTL
jgi:ribosome biogenesis protein SSF1/2